MSGNMLNTKFMPKSLCSFVEMCFDIDLLPSFMLEVED